jgi:predicted GNAT family acetyltransferase
MKLVLSSNLPLLHREALEQLLYFNPRQTAWRNAIAMVLERYGMPEIVSDSASIRIAIGGNQDVQCLFALSGTTHQPALAGMVIFLRTSREELVVVHIAVSRRLGGKGRAPAVVRKLLAEVRAAAKRLKGVNRVTLLYREAKQTMRSVTRSKETPGEGLELRSLPRAS